MGSSAALFLPGWCSANASLEYPCESFLSFRYPCGVVLPDHLFSVPEEFGHVPYGDAWSLEEDSGERVTEPVWRRLVRSLVGEPAVLPEPLELFVPAVRDDLQVLRRVSPEDNLQLEHKTLAAPHNPALPSTLDLCAYPGCDSRSLDAPRRTQIPP